jgi:hypothetical protein
MAITNEQARPAFIVKITPILLIVSVAVLGFVVAQAKGQANQKPNFKRDAARLAVKRANDPAAQST